MINIRMGDAVRTASIQSLILTSFQRRDSERRLSQAKGTRPESNKPEWKVVCTKLPQGF